MQVKDLYQNNNKELMNNIYNTKQDEISKKKRLN